MAIEKYTPVSVKNRAKIFESSNEYSYVKDSKDAVPSTTNGLENKSVEIKTNTDILLQRSSENEEENFISVKQRAQAWENNKTTTDKKDESNKNVVKNLSSSVSEISTDENVSDESGLESERETTFSTPLNFKTNHDKANDVEENVDNQTLENALRSQKEENLSLKQQIQDLESENATLKSGPGKTKTKTNEVLLEKAQKELEVLRNCVTGHGTRLEALNKLNEENQSLKQQIQDLKSKNATLNGESGKTKTKTNEVSLEKIGKRQFSPKVAYASLAAMLVVGAALSIASGLSALLIVAASVVSALIAGGITYAISKPIAEPKPTTKLKEVDIQGSAQQCL
ncbi:hypothetical protein [Wolbachia endosymbiont (group A) of Myopa testacea]|uniref:hypothetical protein n=1 Tax=Wolbachia endosymbiont (group A) of Myopa testacea TaxID=3066148 RepID=UPI003132FE5E